MRCVIKILLLIILPFSYIQAQGVIDDEAKALIRNEKSFHVALYSNGWGGGFTYGKMVNINRKKLYSVELVTVKDAKELKINNPYQPDLRRFVYGKNHEFYNIRFGFGHLIKLYDKKDKGGIEVRCFYKVGALLGVLKPVYYVTGISPLKIERFEPIYHNQTIYGGASYFKGFEEIGIVPGAFMKIGGSFEYSKKDLLINALEGGISLDVFPKKIDLMANDKNKFWFLSIFIGYRFGRVINPRAITQKKENE